MMKKSKITNIKLTKNNGYSLHLEIIINNNRIITILANKKKPYIGKAFYEYTYNRW